MIPNQLMTPSEERAVMLLIGMFQQMILVDHDDYDGHNPKFCNICFVAKVVKKVQ